MKTLPIELVVRLRDEALADRRKNGSTVGMSSEVSRRDWLQREITVTIGSDDLLYAGFCFTDARTGEVLSSRKTLGGVKETIRVERYRKTNWWDEPMVYIDWSNLHKLEKEISYGYSIALHRMNELPRLVSNLPK